MAATVVRSRVARPEITRAPELKPLRPSTRPRRRPQRRRAVVVSAGLVLSSLLSVVAAQAYITVGQARLSRVDQELVTQTAKSNNLEKKVSELENPSRIVSEAQKQGLVSSGQVGDLPSVPLTTIPSR